MTLMRGTACLRSAAAAATVVTGAMGTGTMGTGAMVTGTMGISGAVASMGAMKTFDARRRSNRVVTGVVVSQGKMIKTVKVRIAKQVWNRKVMKNFSDSKTLLVSDPTESSREGDVVLLESGRRVARNVRHSIAGVLAPFGVPLNQRPPLPTAEERAAAWEAKRAAKDIRQAARGRWPAIVRIREREERARSAQSPRGDAVSERQRIPRTLEMFVTRSLKAGAWPPPLGAFLDSAIYEGVDWEVSLAERPAILMREREALKAELDGVEQRMAGETQREREQIAKERVRLLQAIAQSGRRRHRFEDYLEQLGEGRAKGIKSVLDDAEASREAAIKARREIYFRDPTEFFKMTKALSMDEVEKAICAVDLWGRRRLARSVDGETVGPHTDTEAPEHIEALSAPTTKHLDATAAVEAASDPRTQNLPSRNAEAAPLAATTPDPPLSTPGTRQVQDAEDEAANEAASSSAQDSAVSALQTETETEAEQRPSTQPDRADVVAPREKRGKRVRKGSPSAAAASGKPAAGEEGKPKEEKKSGFWGLFGR